MHRFKVFLQWFSNKRFDGPVERKSVKNHLIKVVGKEDLHVSAAKSFKGDASLHNPEDLLLASLTSCHMMSYLYCCSKYKIDVVSYEDHAEALLEVYADGSGKIVKVTLNPSVIICNPDQLELATSLHVEANKLCFIANSCNFIVEHQVNTSVKKC